MKTRGFSLPAHTHIPAHFQVKIPRVLCSSRTWAVWQETGSCPLQTEQRKLFSWFTTSSYLPNTKSHSASSILVINFIQNCRYSHMTLRNTKPLKTLCNVYINNLMHTSDVSRYCTKIAKRKITHTCGNCKSPTIFCEAFFFVFFLLLLLYWSSFYHHNQLPLPGKLYHSVSAGSCWKKYFTCVGWRCVCFQVKRTVLLLKHHLFHLLQSLTVTFLALGQPHRVLLLP